MKRTAVMLSLLATLLTPLPVPASSEPSTPLSTQPPRSKPAGSFLTLRQAIQTGLAQHPLIEQSGYASQIAKAITKQTKREQYPWLEASIAESSGSLRIVTTDGRTIHDRGGRGFDPGGALPHHNQNMLTGGLILNQLITDFGYTAHRVLADEAKQSATEQHIQTNKAVVILNVQKAYLNCLLQQSLVKIATDTLTRRMAVRNQIEVLHRNQLKSKLDLDLVKVEVSSAQLALIAVQNELKQYVAALNNAMGIEGPPEYELESISVAMSPVPAVESLVEHGLRSRPELLEGRDKLQASEELIKAVKALHFGSISAVGSIGVTKYWDAHDGGIRDNEVAPFWGVGATARLPIFAGFKIQNQVTEARHLKGEAEEELQHLANDVILQIVRAYLAQTTNGEQVGLEQERVSFAKEAFALAQERYRLGLSPIVDVIRATTALFEAESRLAGAQYIYKISEAVVAYATGQDYRRY